jgi:hypothetical protein
MKFLAIPDGYIHLLLSFLRHLISFALPNLVPKQVYRVLSTFHEGLFIWNAPIYAANLYIVLLCVIRNSHPGSPFSFHFL